MSRKTKFALIYLTALSLTPSYAEAMHISEGILPAGWAAFWFITAAPFVWLGLRELKTRTDESPQFKPFLGLVGAAIFIISCMPIPVPVAGATSHPAGVGLAAILIGPWLTALVSSVALALQALFLAHGGLTTLGANTMSMGVMGALTGYITFKAGKKIGMSTYMAAFAAGLLSDWVTYAGTSLFMALALHADGSFWKMFLSIMVAFAPTQVPLGLLEGFMTAGAYEFIRSRRPELIYKTLGGKLA
ncbi:MAG TPA: energy-coupling factor ABC transporter permease [Nitrospirae bacterium]|nr:energy-coupling factor ABC transporter permease [Nitrospirota bacterium]